MNLCGNCIHAVPDDRGHGCSWSIAFEPVPGWTATETRIRGYVKDTFSKTYDITACPEFEPG